MVDKLQHTIHNLLTNVDSHFSFVMGSISGTVCWVFSEQFFAEKATSFIISAIAASASLERALNFLKY